MKYAKETKDLNIDKDMLIFGVRYAIGRMTFAPTIAIENVKHNIELLDNRTIRTIIKDIEEHSENLGMQCDKDNWLEFKEYLTRTLKCPAKQRY